jgi:hypothetical protein
VIAKSFLNFHCQKDNSPQASKLEVTITPAKSDLLKYVNERRVLVSKIENFNGDCDINKLLQSIEIFQDLSSKIYILSERCLKSRLITKKEYYRIRDETNEMYTQIKRIVNKNLEKCKVDWYII